MLAPTIITKVKNCETDEVSKYSRCVVDKRIVDDFAAVTGSNFNFMSLIITYVHLQIQIKKQLKKEKMMGNEL